MKAATDVIKRPIITEKSYDLMNSGKYTFEVDKKANKIEVKQAIQTLFNVKVEKVNIMNVRPKKRRVGRYEGLTPSKKKAIITLAKGQTIDRFEV
jgi:large subunit ribosomal protein L23